MLSDSSARLICVPIVRRYSVADIWRKLRINYGDSCSYVHHPSIDSLQQSAQAGCQLCIKVHKKWTALDEPDEWKSAQNPRISLIFDPYRFGYSRVYRELHFIAPLPVLHFSYTLIEKDCEENSAIPSFLLIRLISVLTLTYLLTIVSFDANDSEINPVLEPDNGLGLIKDWVNSCRLGGESHGKCSRKSQCTKPTRLLYLNPYQKDIVQLISIDPENQYSYVTLSYRWGSPEPPKLPRLKDAHKQGRLSMETLQAGVQVADLPQTFHDAVRIVQECGLEYM